MKNFLKIFLYLLDKEDKKGFIFFIFILMLGGFVSLLGVATVIPFVKIVLNPEKISHIPFIGSLSYNSALEISAAALIVVFWLRAIIGALIIKKQTNFLTNLAGKIRHKLFGYYLKSPYLYHINKNSSSLISTLTADINASNSVFNSFGMIINEGITSSILIITLLFVSPVFVITVIGSVLIASKIYIQVLKNKALSSGQDRSASYEAMTKCVSQSLGSMKETKLYNKEEVFMKEMELSSKKIAAANSFEAACTQGGRYLIEAVAVTAVLTMLCIYSFMGYTGEEIFVFISVFGVASVQLLPSLNRMLQAINTIRCAFPSLIKVNNEIKQATLSCARSLQEKNNIEPIHFKHDLKLKNIAFSYNSKNILHDVSLEIEKGKKVALVGESGAGKTTIADIILGLLTPKSGEILLDDKKLTPENILSWQSNLSYIPQMIYLYDSDIRQNVAFGVPEAEINDARIQTCLEMASLSNFIETLSNGTRTCIGENGIQLSGGQRQRIGIARALYRNPSVLVMDEATAALDNKTETEVTQALTVASEGRTIITIAHRISTIMHYDVIYYLDKGSILAKGTYQELVDTSEEFRKFVANSSLNKKTLYC